MEQWTVAGTMHCERRVPLAVVIAQCTMWAFFGLPT
jgi:hypothetical protein